tara:strand:+ start:3441 stop:3695 length:255 start_codon:yes stop_codon:yes gene_type:complete
MTDLRYIGIGEAILIDDGENLSSFVPVKKSVRAGYRGKNIMCPKCRSVTKIYHFAWSALGCQNCKEMVDKYDWYVQDRTTKEAN